MGEKCIVLKHHADAPCLGCHMHTATADHRLGQPNLTGTEGAYKPGGSLSRGGARPPATGDYQAWKPD